MVTENKDSSTSAYTPTTYSLHNEEEFYAELFAFYNLGKLKEPAKSWFKKIH